LAKKLIHLFSRRQFIFFVNAIAFTAGCLIFIQNQTCFIIIRIVQGICIGFYTSTISMTIAEISPVEISGSTGALTQVFVSMGVGTTYLFYYILFKAVPDEKQD
jgi:MFS family permease